MQKKLEKTERPYSTPIKVEPKPSNKDGVSGDRRIVKDGDKKYLYYKVENEWYKTELEKA
jgi:hypothetical protein